MRLSLACNTTRTSITLDPIPILSYQRLCPSSPSLRSSSLLAFLHHRPSHSLVLVPVLVLLLNLWSIPQETSRSCVKWLCQSTKVWSLLPTPGISTPASIAHDCQWALLTTISSLCSFLVLSLVSPHSCEPLLAPRQILTQGSRIASPTYPPCNTQNHCSVSNHCIGSVQSLVCLSLSLHTARSVPMLSSTPVPHIGWPSSRLPHQRRSCRKH